MCARGHTHARPQNSAVTLYFKFSAPLMCVKFMIFLHGGVEAMVEEGNADAKHAQISVSRSQKGKIKQ